MGMWLLGFTRQLYQDRAISPRLVFPRGSAASALNSTQTEHNSIGAGLDENDDHRQAGGEAVNLHAGEAMCASACAPRG